MKNKRTKRHHGFTLAEVLITLVIIGIIAAITVSTLSVNLQKEHIERCKKVYSTLSQAANRAISDNGPMHVWELTSDNQQENNRTFVENYILPYIINAKDCGEDSTGQCKFEYKWLNDNEVKFLGGDWYKIALNDGSIIAFQTNKTADNSYSWVLAYTDVNGAKKPNKFARDIYTFVYWLQNPNTDYRRGRFEAYGNDWPRESLITSQGTNACNKSSSGQLCAALLMKDSWEIKEDYPR